MVIPFIINITMEMNFRVKFTPNFYKKGHLCRVPHLSKSYLVPEVWRLIFCKSKENQYLVQKYGGQYFAKVKGINILSRSMEADTFDKRIGAYGYIL